MGEGRGGEGGREAELYSLKYLGAQIGQCLMVSGKVICGWSSDFPKMQYRTTDAVKMELLEKGSAAHLNRATSLLEGTVGAQRARRQS